MSGTLTGHIVQAYDEEGAAPDPSTGQWRIVQQLNVQLKATADEKPYSFTMPITEKTVSLQQLQKWQEEDQEVTVFISSIRAQPFLHEEGKSYPNSGKKVQVKGPKNVAVDAEIDAFVALQAYDVQPAGSFDLVDIGKRAHGEYAKQRAQIRSRSVGERKRKASERARKKMEEENAKQATQQTQKKSA